MIWSGSKALIAAIIMEIIQRLITVIWVFRIAVGWLLKVKNSKTMVRKTRQAASRWEKITMVCFWNAKCDQRGLLRLFISIYNFMLFTIPLPLCAMLLYYEGVFSMEAAQRLHSIHFNLDIFVSTPVCIYTLRKFGNRSL